jgi:hypothetical protein
VRQQSHPPGGPGDGGVHKWDTFAIEDIWAGEALIWITGGLVFSQADGNQGTMKRFEQMYPYITAWVQDGYIEVGNDGYSRSFLRVLDEGGQIWESNDEYSSLDEALAAMDTAIAQWCQVQMPDLDIGGGDGYSFTPKQGQYLAFIYNYTQIHGRPPAEAELQRFFGTTPPTVHQMILRLEQDGLITRRPGEPRSVQVVVPARFLPILERLDRN